MYALLMAALVLFPWLLAGHIALGSFRANRQGRPEAGGSKEEFMESSPQ